MIADNLTRQPLEAPEPTISELLAGILGTLRRRRWWVLASLAGVSLTAAGVVMALPDEYESSATFVVLQPRISQRFVEPFVPMAPTDAFLAMNREILSRTQLVKIIEDLGLYPALREKNASPDTLAAEMRKHIDVEAQDWTKLGEIVSFRMSYRARSPEIAQEVTARLANLFIEENARKRNSQAETTTRFLSEQIETARQRMAEQEQRVRDYKVKNLEQLPQQQQALLGALTELRIRLQSVSSSLIRAEQQRGSLRALLNNHAGKLENDKQELLRRYTPKHPEVVRKEQEIARVRLMAAQLEAGKPADGADGGVDDPQMAMLRTQIAENVAEVESLRREQDRINADLARNQALLRLTPVREQELTDILRDYDLYKKDYADLLEKKLNADLSANLDQKNEGQQFRMVDAPTMPDRPSGPKRLKISLGASGAGMALGLVLAFFADNRRRVFYSEKEIRSSYAVPMVVAIPPLPTGAEQKQRRRRILAECVAACVSLVLAGAAQLYVYWNG